MSLEFAPHTFVAESRELLRTMEDALLTLEQSPRDTEAVNAVFRAMHTIKGSAGIFGFDVIVEVAHVMESAIDEVRAGRIQVDEVLVALLLTCGDHVATLIDCLEVDDREARLESARPQGVQLLRQLARYADESAEGVGAAAVRRAADAPTPGEVASVASEDWHVSIRFHQDVLRHGMDPLSFLRYLSTLGEIKTIVPLFDAMPPAQAMDPQACYVGVELQFAGSVVLADIEDAFEYVRDDSSITILPPHAPIAQFAALLSALPEGPQRVGECLLACGALTPQELEQALRPQEHARALEPAPAAGSTAADPDVDAPTVPSARDRKAIDHRSVRVHAAKLDELITLVGEMVIASAGVSLCAAKNADSDLREATASMSRLVEEVRDGALGLRMVPVGETFNRFNRVVRDLGRELGKEVTLAISGAETELDKSMVEKLNDPLMHLVRNALDHGIEPAEQRLAMGKPARGEVRLNAYHETGNIVIEVADDGAGLDRDLILARALERGMVQEGQDLSEQEIFQLVTEPGFSTAATVTSISGRGVGMDVVRRNVEALRGSLSIASSRHEGTLVALRVPLTLAIIDGFLVSVGCSTYVLPLQTVVECIELAAEDRSRVRESGYVNLRGEVLPLLRLRDMFEVPGQPGKRENVVVVHYGGQQAGFVVDALLGEFQTVIKPLGRLFDRLAGISGSTILGTGDVALILDVPGLIQKVLAADADRLSRSENRSAAGPRRPAVNGAPALHGART